VTTDVANAFWQSSVSCEEVFFVMEKLQVNFNGKNLPITENAVLEYPNFGACTFKLSFKNVNNTYNPRLHHLVEIST